MYETRIFCRRNSLLGMKPSSGNKPHFCVMFWWRKPSKNYVLYSEFSSVTEVGFVLRNEFLPQKMGGLCATIRTTCYRRSWRAVYKLQCSQQSTTAKRWEFGTRPLIGARIFVHQCFGRLGNVPNEQPAHPLSVSAPIVVLLCYGS